MQLFINGLGDNSEHLCETCKYSYKCYRLNHIDNTITKLEMKSFKDWEMDLEVYYTVNSCDLYVPDKELLLKLKGEDG